MSPSLPTNFNDTSGLLEYGKDLGITVGVGFVVPAIVLSLILIVVFVKFCGGQEKPDVFTSTSRKALIVSSVVVVAIAIATCAVGWSSNNQAHAQVQDGSTTVQQVIMSSGSIMLSVNNTVFDFRSQLFGEVNKTWAIAANLSFILVPIDSISGVIGNARGAVNNLTAITNVAVKNITIVKVDLNNLDEEEKAGVITGLPNVTEIPDIGNKFVVALNTSIGNINSVAGLAANFSSNVNQSITQVSSTVENELIVQTNNYDAKVNEVLSYFNEFYGKVTETNTSYNKYSSEVIHYSSIRKSAVAGVLVLPIVLAGLSLAGIFFKLKPILKLTSAFCFIFMFWYFLVAGVNYAAYTLINDVCQEQDQIVASALSISKSEITIPGTNTSIDVSAKVALLLKCDGNTTIVDIFEFNFLINDLTDTIQTLMQNVITEVQQLNQSQNYQNALQDLSNFKNNTVNLDFIQNTNLTDVHVKLNNVTTQLNNAINNPLYNQSIQDVNDITNNLQLTNGSTVHIFYDSSNIITLNCTTDPYNKLNSTTQQDLCEKATTAITLTVSRNRAIASANVINGNVSDINERLYGLQATLPAIYYYQNQTSLWASDIQGDLTTSYNEANGMIVKGEGIASTVEQLISSEVSTIVNYTQCAFVGNAYHHLSSILCSNIKSSLETLAAMMILGALVLFTSAVVSMITVYKLEKDMYSKYDS